MVTGINSLLLLTKSFSAFPSPLYYLNSGPHLLSLELLHQPPREGVSRNPYFPESPLCSWLNSTDQNYDHLSSPREEADSPSEMHSVLLPWFSAWEEFPVYNFMPFWGWLQAIFFQRSVMTNYLHKRPRPWSIPESPKDILSNWALSLCVHTDLSKQEARCPSSMHSPCILTLHPLTATLLSFKHLCNIYVTLCYINIYVKHYV